MDINGRILTSDCTHDVRHKVSWREGWMTPFSVKLLGAHDLREGYPHREVSSGNFHWLSLARLGRDEFESDQVDFHGVTKVWLRCEVGWMTLRAIDFWHWPRLDQVWLKRILGILGGNRVWSVFVVYVTSRTDIQNSFLFVYLFRPIGECSSLYLWVEGTKVGPLDFISRYIGFLFNWVCLDW